MTDYPSDTSVQPDVEAFFDTVPSTNSYIVKDPGSDAFALVVRIIDFDCAADGREIAWETMVGEHCVANAHVGGGKAREDFVTFCTERDSQLKVHGLIFPSLQVKMLACEMPSGAEANPMMKVAVNGH